MYKDLSLKEKAKVLLYGSKLGLTSVEDIAKLYDDAIGHKFAEGSMYTPDWDPNNPYHYHTANGEKVVITPEDWEKHKGLPYFKQVEDAVLAEQAAHPGPEYIINPQFSEDLRRVYKGNMGPSYQNYSSFSGNLPQGYSFTPEGLVQDNQGNIYVLKGFRQTPRFTYDESNPLTFPVLEGRNQGNVTFYPVNMEKTIKPSLPVSSIMNVDKEHESAIRKAQNQYEYAISPMFDLKGSYLEDPKYGEISYITDIIGRAVNTSDPYEDIIVSPAEFALIKSTYKKDKNKEFISAIHEHPEWDNSFYWEWVNQDNPWMWKDIDGTYTDASPKPRKISRKEAEKKAVIEVGPLQVGDVLTYAKGGPIVSPYGQWKYPGRDTIIPSNNITMDNVNYPVLGVSDTGDTKIMMPWNDYKFRGSMVYEHPLIGNQFQLGGLAKPFSYGDIPDVRYLKGGNIFLEKGFISKIKPIEEYITPIEPQVLDNTYVVEDYPYYLLPEVLNTNKRLSDEEISNYYGSNILWTMENPNHKGLNPDGTYSAYEDEAGFNFGPGLHAKSNNLDINKTYTRLELDSIASNVALNYMKLISEDLETMQDGRYAGTRDTLSAGPLLTMLDIAYNVKPKDKGNMPQKWPNLTDSLINGNIEKAKENTYSGSTRRQKMRNQMIVYKPLEGITVHNEALGGNLFAAGGPKKKLKSPEEILAEKYGVEPVVDNTSFVVSPITIQDKKDAAKYKEEQRKAEIQKQQAARTPILRADVVSLEDRDKYRNQAEWSHIMDNANEAAANFGYSIGANHPMTINEVNSNTLGALETAGWMIAPELMGLGATGYYMATNRPEKAAITAALSLGPGIIRGIKGATNTRLLKQEVKEMDKALKLWKGNNSIPFNEAHVIYSPYSNSKSASNISALDYNTAQQIQSFTNARNKFAQKHNLPIIGYNYNLPLEELYNEGKQVIKDANAFYRGVNFWKEAAEGVGILDEKAFKEYAATHPWEGARDIWITPKKEYAGLYGDPLRVVRPYELGKNPINWFNEGDFDFKLAEGLRTPNATEGIYMPWRDEPKEWWRWHTIDEPYIKSFNPREEAELLYIGDKPLNIYKKGGSIHIKPENRGKFTALKKRTGHSASWFKVHGTPALRKMATFALNARRWKHDDGGHLFLEDGQIFKRPQDDLTGRNILTSPILPPKSYYEQFTIPELELKKPQPLQPLEGTYGNKYSELVPMSDGTYVNNPINKGLQLDWRTHALELAPFFAIGAGPAIGSIATWLASKPALYNLGRMTLGSEIGGRSVDLASNLLTGNTWGLNIGNAVESITGWNPNNTMVGLFVTDATNPGYAMNWWDKVGNLGLMSAPIISKTKHHATNYNESTVSEYKNLRRKLSKGLLSKILQENGNIRPLSGENRSLTFTDVHPRKAPYYIETDVPIESTLEGVGSIANFDKKPFSTRYKLPKDYSLNIYDDNVKVYRKNGNKYDLVDKEFLFNTPELRFDLINSNKKFRNTKDLKLSDHHIVLSESPIQTLKSSTFYLEDIIPKDEMFRLQDFNPNLVYKEYYGDIFPDANLNSDEYATMLKNAIRNTDSPSKIAEDVGVLAQRFYTNKYGIKPFALSEQEWSNLGQSILEKQRQLGNNVFFHSTLNEPFSNIDNLKLNLVNDGFLGKGFYLSDLPSSDYGPVVLPFSVPQGKQVILTKGNNRLRADIKEVDDFLKNITKSRFKWTKEGFKEKPYGYWPGIQETSRDPKGWNNLIKNLDFDLVKSKESSKGIGLTYPEILIPPDKIYKLEMLFKNPTEMKHGGFIYY